MAAMTERLIPCAACSRHVKASDAECPFCRASMLTVSAPATTPYRRMAAAAAVAAGVVALTGCGSSSGGSASGDDASTADDASPFGDDASVGTFYGIASFDASGVVFYGAANFDAGPPPADANDEGSAVAFYGSPGVPDSGTAPDGAVDGSPGGSSDASDSG
jgi:hypothetical protein